MNFSVLISLYFREKSSNFDEAFLSLWNNQSTKPTEIVLVLDGPIGNDLEVCVKKWKFLIGDALKIIPLVENLGLGKALNEGLKYCKYEWIFRMDTDDICTPDRFEKQISYIKKHNDIVLFGGQILEFNENPLDLNSLKFVPTLHNDILKYAKIRSPFNHVSVAFRKSIIKSVGGYHHHPMMEDYNLWLRIISAGYKLGNLDDILLYVRVGNGMHAKRKGLQYIKSEKQLLDLKNKLKLQNPLYANMIFLVRSFFRLLPSTVLEKFYNSFLRKKNDLKMVNNSETTH